MKTPLDHLAERKNHIFDVDDCLFPRSTGIHTDIKHSIVRHFNQIANLDPQFKTKFSDIVHNLGRQDDFDINNVEYNDLEAAFLPMITATKWQNNRDNFIAKVDQYYQADYSKVQPDQKLVQAFQKAKEKGIELYIYTNGASHPDTGKELHAQRVLKALGFDNEWVEFLRGRTHDLLKSERLGNGKPYTSSFVQMLSGFGLEAKDSVFYDDTVPNIVTAHKLGVETVWPWLTDAPAPQDIEVLARSINAYKTRDTGETLSQIADLYTPNTPMAG